MKKLLISSAYIITSILLGILWFFPVVPYLFYITFADDVMKDRMQVALIEFYGIAQETLWYASEGDPVSITEKSVRLWDTLECTGFGYGYF